MKEGANNIARSIHQRLINLSKTRGEDPNLVLIRYAIERFLYRISCSAQSDKFILKGAMLFATWTGRQHRPTKDLDLLGFGNASAEQLRKIFVEICKTKVEPDGLEFNPNTIQTILSLFSRFYNTYTVHYYMWGEFRNYFFNALHF